MGRPKRSPIIIGEADFPHGFASDTLSRSKGLDSSSSSNSQSPSANPAWNDYTRTPDSGDMGSVSSEATLANSSSPSLSHYEFHLGDSHNSPGSGSSNSTKSEVLNLLVVLTISHPSAFFIVPACPYAASIYSIPYLIRIFPLSPQRRNFLLIWPSNPLFS